MKADRRHCMFANTGPEPFRTGPGNAAPASSCRGPLPHAGGPMAGAVSFSREGRKGREDFKPQVQAPRIVANNEFTSLLQGARVRRDRKEAFSLPANRKVLHPWRSAAGGLQPAGPGKPRWEDTERSHLPREGNRQVTFLQFSSRGNTPFRRRARAFISQNLCETFP